MLRRVALRCAAARCGGDAARRRDASTAAVLHRWSAASSARNARPDSRPKRDDECADKPQDGSKSLPIDPPAPILPTGEIARSRGLSDRPPFARRSSRLDLLGVVLGVNLVVKFLKHAAKSEARASAAIRQEADRQRMQGRQSPTTRSRARPCPCRPLALQAQFGPTPG